jgi:hypothetical protein
MDQKVESPSAGAHWAATPRIEGVINYVGPMDVRPQFFARDYSRDNLKIDGEPMPVADLRSRRGDTSLDAEGFRLVDHKSLVADFRDDAEVKSAYLEEVAALIGRVSGADKVLVSPSAILRFGERSGEYRRSFNSRPARFAHVDVTPESAPGLLKSALGPDAPWPRRVVGYNIWRVISDPPQDVPLAVCDVRSIEVADRVRADAIFDPEEGPGFSFEAFLLKHNPAHRWTYFSGMTRDEALVFKNYDSETKDGGGVPHVAFDDPTCPEDAAPRASIEARGYALFD